MMAYCGLRVSISIHAPRVRCDQRTTACFRCFSNFNPRTSCEVRLRLCKQHLLRSAISIHAPRVRCDCRLYLPQPRRRLISIHAPRVRCDYKYNRRFRTDSYFNPRTSCEVRHSLLSLHRCSDGNFNPRTSCEVRPIQEYDRHAGHTISIHAPRVRCDNPLSDICCQYTHFNPRTSCEVRLYICNLRDFFIEFQSTHLV